MDTTQPLPLLGGLTPERFMQKYWQKKPLLVRGAIPGFGPVLERNALFALAEQEGVESRLVQQGAKGWTLRNGPFARRALPPLSRRQWSLLVQGVDLHSDAAHALLQAFRFVPDARLDDLMVSYASDGGGVGPHFDSYDVFLLQAHGQRRWRIGRQRDFQLQEGVPLKILAAFEPEEEYVLEPGDMLYLPPRYAHDGVAIGECMTYSIGFRAPGRGGIARELLQRLADTAEDALGPALYRDPRQPATAQPAAVPADVRAFAAEALRALLDDPAALDCALGEILSEPKAQVWFGEGHDLPAGHGVALDRRSRMLYDAGHVYLNGESWRAGGRDARLMQRLADLRRLSAREVASASAGARELLAQWCEDGWLQADPHG
ncbi:JmjC domain-containing protein [Pseudorhodoferax sp. Leaf274]|uniref:JmjC domain-containing protein n=1 Tax=Pseudorhodoferax sp. Leaf274 TaxID=1736318 RepID=UPI0007025070|nr:cupin domain-containing protein [Pseudorhodoferax sp. Leaf274]KQP43347.1 cupin [Pseudorhodoferax sp. Leaf274]